MDSLFKEIICYEDSPKYVEVVDIVSRKEYAKRPRFMNQGSQILCREFKICLGLRYRLLSQDTYTVKIAYDLLIVYLVTQGLKEET